VLPVKGIEDVLRHVLRLVAIAEDAVGNGGNSPVLIEEEAIERPRSPFYLSPFAQGIRHPATSILSFIPIAPPGAGM
jgi:hypothetical protein